MDDPFDVVVIGAGINGAAISHALTRAALDVLIVDQGDIGGGTSQASTMLIWGGLLYLKDLEFATVARLCRERDRLVADEPDLVQPCEVRYLPTPGARPRALVQVALHAYWLMGRARRRRPKRRRRFDEQPLLTNERAGAYCFEEGALASSDARFVLEWVRRSGALGADVRTYTRVVGCQENDDGRCRLALKDTITGVESSVVARVVVNAAGGWADDVNRLAGIETPYRHVLSRGVSIALPRDSRHRAHLVFDTDEGNALTLAPWGPVSLWASTESLHPDMAGAGRVAPEDIAYMLDQYNARFRAHVTVDDIVSVRVGVRPVPVERGQTVDGKGLGLSRHHKLHVDAVRPWVTVYGGKLSGCRGLAADVMTLVHRRHRPVGRHRQASSGERPAMRGFPGLPIPIVSPEWTVSHEFCRTLDDYLRRRTNIAQWVPRGGFGRHDEYAREIHALAAALHEGDEAAAARDVALYRARIDADAEVLRAAGRVATSPVVACITRSARMTPAALPAILGGSPAVTLDQTAALKWPLLDADDEAAVLEVMRDGDLSNHPVTRVLEDDFRRRLGCRHALAHANGTLGLLAAFHALDLQPGDEILVPSATFWASVVPMLWVGAVPVFCEIEGERFALDPADIERRITSRTKAMVLVHLWGIPAKVDALLDVARRHGLKVIEDASHALGATSGGVACGRFGDISVFSLQTSKLAAAGEGGVFLTDDDTYMERAICLGDIVRIYELATPAKRFAATSFGIKTRMAPLSAAVGRTQLAKLDRHNARRAANIEALGARLQALGFDTLPSPAGTSRVYFEHLVRYDPAQFDGLPVSALIAALQAEGCQATGPRYPLVHEQPFFTEGHWRRVARLPPGDHADWRPPHLPMSAAVQQHMLRLPTFPWAEPALIEQYATAFEKIHAAAPRIPRPVHA